LIFPSATKEQLQADPPTDLVVADVILAELPNNVAPRGVAAAAKAAAHARWIQLTNQMREFQDCWKSSDLRGEIWDEQTPNKIDDTFAGDVIECYAAWAGHHDPQDYQRNRRRVMRLLAGRTACRNFPTAAGRAGVPKSSLDGARETVLVDLSPQRGETDE